MAARFSGRSAIVTGGVSGIGAGIAARLHAEGARVSLWDRDAAALANAEAPHKVTLDVTDAVRRAARRRRDGRALGKIDILIACAGITGPNATVWDYPVAEWDRVIDVNLNGVFYCNRAVVPHMLRNDYGRIVNIASIAGKEGNPNAAAYSASKAGVIGLTKSLGKELARTRNPRQLRHARRGPHADLRADDAGAHRLDAVEDPDRPVRRHRRDRLAGLLAGERGMQLFHRRGVRYLRRPRDLLSRETFMDSETLAFTPAVELADHDPAEEAVAGRADERAAGNGSRR